MSADTNKLAGAVRMVRNMLERDGKKPSRIEAGEELALVSQRVIDRIAELEAKLANAESEKDKLGLSLFVATNFSECCLNELTEAAQTLGQKFDKQNILDKANELLGYTPKDFEAYVESEFKARLGEPVAYMWTHSGGTEIHAYESITFHNTPLYALKED